MRIIINKRNKAIQLEMAMHFVFIDEENAVHDS